MTKEDKSKALAEADPGEVVGRPISRFEALRITRQILEEAEQERLALAEYEARRGIQWADET